VLLTPDVTPPPSLQCDLSSTEQIDALKQAPCGFNCKSLESLTLHPDDGRLQCQCPRALRRWHAAYDDACDDLNSTAGVTHDALLARARWKDVSDSLGVSAHGFFLCFRRPTVEVTVERAGQCCCSADGNQGVNG
jgi:hypothetical protein